MFDIRPTLDILSILHLYATKHGMVYFTTLQCAFTFNYKTQINNATQNHGC